MSQHQTLGPIAPPFSWTPLHAFVVQAVLLGFLLGATSVFSPMVAVWSMAGFALASFLAGRSLFKTFPHEVLGLCNSVTLARLAMVATLFGVLFDMGAVSPWVVFGIGALALALDGLDGWLARRAELQSDFGARFDMETDAVLGAVLALWVLLSGTAGPEVLLLGFMRYAFVAASLWLPQLRTNLPHSFRRKVICVAQIGALLALTCPLIPTALVAPLVFGASAALTYSFAVDIRWLMRRSV